MTTAKPNDDGRSKNRRVLGVVNTDEYHFAMMMVMMTIEMRKLLQTEKNYDAQQTTEKST